MSAIVFGRVGNASLKLDAAAVEVALRYTQRSPDAPEAGGVLLGRHILGTRDVVVDAVTEPTPGDKQTRFSFQRSEAPHQQLVDQAWKASRGTCVYLGEWHTHPERHPAPSSIDIADWLTRLRLDEVDSESMFFLIVGQRRIVAWEGNRSTRELIRLRQITKGQFTPSCATP